MARPASRSALTVLVALLLATAAMAAGCTSTEDGSDAEVFSVATTTQVADLVRSVGGDRVDVHQFLTPGADPHEYEPRPSDAQAVAESAVVFESGGDVDEWLGDVIENAGGDAEVVTLLDTAHPPGQGTAADDPHWWQDPRNAVAAVEAIAHALSEADPDGADVYRRNARRYTSQLNQLDAAISRCMGRIPAEARKLVTTHDSYGYFADRYGIEVIGALIPSRSSQAQPSAGETAALVDQIEREGVRTIFPESALNPELEEAVANEAGATVGDPLWADSLGPQGSEGETYLDALASDAEAMAAGFTGDEERCGLDV